MKILVDAVGLQRVADLLRDYYHACNMQEDKNVILFDARTLIQKLLDTGITIEDTELAEPTLAGIIKLHSFYS